MLEKTVKRNKSIILLRCMVVPLVLLLLIFPLIPSASAAEYGLLDYNDYIASTEFDGTNDNVVVKFPSSLAIIDFYRMLPTPETRLDQVDASAYTWSIEAGNTYRFYGYPMGYFDSRNNNRLDLSNIPNGTNVHFDVTFHWGISDAIVATPYYSCIVFYYGDNGSLLSQTFWEGKGPGEGAPYDEDTWSFDLTIDKPNGAKSLLFYAQLSHMECYQSGDITVSLDNFSMNFSVSALYRLQEQTGKNSAVLSNIERQLEQQGQTIEEFVSEQQKTNEKLDNLPGEIGDVMQDVIENEKQEAESSGNDFVDQILDALPDPSTDVLAALKSLTDATAYTGTEAVLPIPAIVLPGIDGLFPEAVIWEGTQFDFGEYLGFIPSSLLTLVQCLFTIAIVLFCVYELKGIISYCLTLRESKGG